MTETPDPSAHPAGEPPPPDPQPVRAGEVRVPHAMSSGGVPAWAAEPADGDRCAGVVLIHDRDGLTASLRALSARLAATGLLVVTPDLDAREGGEPSDPEAVVDLDAAVGYLRAHPRGNGRAGAVGLGWGGRLALILATSPAAPDRVVGLRGRGMSRRTAAVDSRRPQVAVERVDWLRVPFLGVFTDTDEDPSDADVAELRAALLARGLEHRVVVLPEDDADLLAAPLGDAPSLDRPSAWSETLAWLESLR